VIGSTRQVAVFAFGAPIDMRKGFDGLAAVVTLQLGRDPLSGDVFLFVNRTLCLAKIQSGSRDDSFRGSHAGC
jgi:transposase